MLIRFNVENFLSFENKQELVMIPAKRIRNKKDHTISQDDFSLLKAAAVYGANASGKSNLVEALNFAKYVITKKLPIDSTRMYCRTKKENKQKITKFEFEIFKNNKYFAYGFSMNLYDHIILTEWIYQLYPNKEKEKMLFERETKSKRLNLGSDVKLGSINDEIRFKACKLDFEENRNNKSLFITEINRRMNTGKTSLAFFKDVYDWFDNDLKVFVPESPITDFEYFYVDKCLDKTNEIIEAFDTGISKLIVQEITLTEFKEKIPGFIANEIITEFKNKQEENDDELIQMSMRFNDVFYNIKGKKAEDLEITTIMLKHKNSDSIYDFSEESDGTRRLFDLLDILINNENNKIFVIDELDRSLHPKLTYRFIELFFDLLKESNIQLIFTTHESTIMTQNLLRRDEIWFIERDNNNSSKLYSLDRFNERYDKKLSKAYLEGRYGAIPIFKQLSFKDGECN